MTVALVLRCGHWHGAPLARVSLIQMSQPCSPVLREVLHCVPKSGILCSWDTTFGVWDFFSVKALGIILGGCLRGRTPATTAVTTLSNHRPLMSSM